MIDIHIKAKAKASCTKNSLERGAQKGFVKGEEFCFSFCDFSSESLFVNPNHTLMLLNQSEASTSDLICLHMKVN